MTLRDKLLILICALCTILVLMPQDVTAFPSRSLHPQISQPDWGEPYNLSHSGAASQPILILGSDNTLQAFWWDEFDHVLTATRTDSSWSAPEQASLTQTVLQGQGVNAEFVSVPVGEMPGIYADNVGYAHTLWLGVENEETELRPLLTNRLFISTTQWSSPIQVAESALMWDMVAGPTGRLHLVYIRATHSAAEPAGIVYRRSADNGLTWTSPVVLYSSIYFRLLQAENAQLDILADAAGTIFVSSQSLRPSQPFFIRSTDGGVNWDEPVFVGTADNPATNAYFYLNASTTGENEEDTSPAEVHILWETDLPTVLCALFHQHSPDGGTTWSESVRVLEDLRTCPVAPTFLLSGDGGMLLLSGENSSALNLAAWEPYSNQWSEVQSLSLDVENPNLETALMLSDLDVHLLDGTLTIAGTGQDGEIWILQTDLDLFSWAFAPPSPWSQPLPVADSAGVLSSPAVVVDNEQRIHVLWSEAPAAGQPATTIYYTRWDGARWSIPIVLYRAVTGKADQPALSVVGDRLHAVWSSGTEGHILYSRAYVSDAHTSTGWSDVRQLGDFTSGSAPAITADLLGRLYVAFAVPVNEDRGIYLTRSTDEGESWTDPVQVVDTVAQGWLRADDPVLAVDERGIIHCAWLQAPLPGNGLPEAVYYARSIDNGDTWSAPFLLAEGTFIEPRLVTTLHGQVIAFVSDMRQNVVRYRLTNDGGETWDTVSTIPGVRNVAGPVAFSVDGSGIIHMMAPLLVTGGTALQYATWSGNSWQLASAYSLPEQFGPPAGISLAVQGDIGQLDTVLTGSAETSGLWYLSRTITPVTGQPAILITPEPTATLTPSPTPLPTSTPRPTVAPDLGDPGMPTLEIGPLSQPLSAFWGIGLALLVVVILVVSQVTRRR